MEEISGGNEYVYGIDFGDGSLDAYLFPNSTNCIH